MHDRQHMHAVVHFLINNSVRKIRNPNPANRVFQKRKPIRLPGDGFFSRRKSMQKRPREFRPRTRVSLGGGGEFNIGFTV